ncbi:hypothetical protein HYH03_014652 [Edaphochlamys debaryana]|uniref:Uncharacterized protein n=1 Tax=Edaphochlamys debaryana TaxID=47281 RepID=A0A835XTQ0_9CHLO|nr:hypothetical protein HYH03_014652 [Edaphochlamys debaryana]|eukprot:KAG2486725.1 hypothetical protein HYH03_014652 [Edaphochlamys debaryana]
MPSADGTKSRSTGDGQRFNLPEVAAAAAGGGGDGAVDVPSTRFRRRKGPSATQVVFGFARPEAGGGQGKDSIAQLLTLVPQSSRPPPPRAGERQANPSVSVAAAGPSEDLAAAAAANLATASAFTSAGGRSRGLDPDAPTTWRVLNSELEGQAPPGPGAGPAGPSGPLPVVEREPRRCWSPEP